MSPSSGWPGLSVFRLGTDDPSAGSGQALLVAALRALTSDSHSAKGARRRYRQTNAHTNQSDGSTAPHVCLGDCGCRAHRYTCPTAGVGRQSDAVLSAAYARLQAAYPAASVTTVAAYREEAVWLAHHLLATIQHKKAEIARLQELFLQHPDHELFASLPGTGDFLAPALLAKFGDTCTCAARHRGASVIVNVSPLRRVSSVSPAPVR